MNKDCGITLPNYMPECGRPFVPSDNISFDFRKIDDDVFRMRKFFNGSMVDAHNGTLQECFDYFNIILTT